VQRRDRASIWHQDGERIVNACKSNQGGRLTIISDMQANRASAQNLGLFAKIGQIDAD
jgi:hypothetical protein